MDRVDYEKACKIWSYDSKELLEAAKDGAYGLAHYCDFKRDQLLEAGWTVEQLMNETDHILMISLPRKTTGLVPVD